jgi:hypothetical protein
MPQLSGEKKADRFWFAAWEANTQSRCGWDAGPARQFPALAVAGDASGADGRLKKRTGFGSHPGRQKLKPDAAGTQVRHDNFPLAVAGDASGADGRLKKRTGFGSHPEGAKTQARCGRGVTSASDLRRPVQRLWPENTATMQKEMASPASWFARFLSIFPRRYVRRSELIDCIKREKR